MNRAIGIVRVSETGGRNGDRFHSPAEQQERIEQVCKREGLELIDVVSELDVSGRKPLNQRRGLTAAVEAVESGQATVIAAAYFDRLFRSLSTQAEVIQRVEAVGGRVLAVDVGHITSASAAQWLSSTMIGAVAEYYSRSVGERLTGTQARCVARGVAPFPLPPGYRRRDDGVAEPDERAQVVVEAWRMRAAGASMPVIRRWLAEQDVRMSLGGLTRLLSNRFYLGELYYRRDGIEPNLTAHEPIIDRDLFERVQRTKGTLRGRTSKSPHLLARLEVLRCGSCGGRMSVTSKSGGVHPFYRCTASDCDRRMTISASVAEEKVWNEVRDAMRDAQGRASMAESAQEAISRLSRAQGALDTALRVFELTGAQNESAAVEKITGLVAARDAAQTEVDRIGPEMEFTTDPEDLSFDRRRQAIKLAARSATVAAGGRGADRITVDLRL